MSTLVPPLFAGLVDDAAAFSPDGTTPPDAAGLPHALAEHRQHRAAWYAPLVGPLLVPASAVAALPPPALPTGGGPTGPLTVAIVADTGIGPLPAVVRQATAHEHVRVRQVEVAVAKRGEDPQPGLRRMIACAADWPAVTGYAEIPLAWGLLAALDTVTEARARGLDIAVKFRTGGLAAELFPTPVELAAVICACRDRKLPFKLTAGLHHALRHNDPETGFTHHGFLNVLVATTLAADGAEVADVAEVLAATHPVPLIEPSRARREQDRPLWVGFGSCSVVEPLTDLIRFGLVNGGFE